MLKDPGTHAGDVRHTKRSLPSLNEHLSHKSLTPEHVRVSLISLLTPSNIAALDEKLFELVEQALDVADIQGVIATKIRQFSPLRMEAIIMEVSRKELGMIVSLGGILGFVIGVLQSGLMVLMGVGGGIVIPHSALYNF